MLFQINAEVMIKKTKEVKKLSSKLNKFEGYKNCSDGGVCQEKFDN